MKVTTRRERTFLALYYLALAVLAALATLAASQLPGCAWSHKDTVDLRTESRRIEGDGPSTWARTIHGRKEWLRPDGGVRARAFIDTTEHEERDGGFAVQETAVDLHTVDAGKTAPAIPIFRIAGAVAALAAGVYFFIRWRMRAARTLLALLPSPSTEGKPPAPKA